MAFVYVQNPTGGVFGGDRLRVEIAAGPGARVHLTGQSATKLCRGVDPATAIQELRFDVAAGAVVEHIPDALIPYPGARYVQRTEAHHRRGRDVRRGRAARRPAAAASASRSSRSSCGPRSSRPTASSAPMRWS